METIALSFLIGFGIVAVFVVCAVAFGYVLDGMNMSRESHKNDPEPERKRYPKPPAIPEWRPPVHDKRWQEYVERINRHD